MYYVILKVLRLKVLFYILLSAPNILGAQVVNTSGGTIDSENFIIDFSIGETCTSIYQNNILITEGFIQPYYTDISSVEKVESEFYFYPNPTTGIVYLSQKKAFLSDEFLLLDILGNQWTMEVNSNGFIDLSNLHIGVYTILCRNNESGKYYSFKLLKI